MSRRSVLADRFFGLQLHVRSMTRAGLTFRVSEEWSAPDQFGDGGKQQSFAVTLPPEWDLPVALNVEQQGMNSDGPWGVDLYVAPGQEPFTPAEARAIAQALLATADLAERAEALEQGHLPAEAPC